MPFRWVGIKHTERRPFYNRTQKSIIMARYNMKLLYEGAQEVYEYTLSMHELNIWVAMIGYLYIKAAMYDL